MLHGKYPYLSGYRNVVADLERPELRIKKFGQVRTYFTPAGIPFTKMPTVQKCVVSDHGIMADLDTGGIIETGQPMNRTVPADFNPENISVEKKSDRMAWNNPG
jgi:hypothetical protein